MEIKSLKGIDSELIFKAFDLAFSDYDIQINQVQLQAMLKRRGFVPELSFAAFDDGDIVAFTLNGIGDFNGLSTAYDTGTGTLKEYRGRGLATKIFEYSIPYLKEANIQQYLLEVLQHNTKAVSIYRNIGFETSREFNYFVQQNENINIGATKDSYSIQIIDFEALNSVSDFWDFHPSWQNSFDSIKRSASNFIHLGAFDKQKLIGYCVFEPISGDITQLAVDKENRRKGVATLLLKEAIRLNKNASIKLINTDTLCGSINEFLKARNIELKGKQFEMIKNL